MRRKLPVTENSTSFVFQAGQPYIESALRFRYEFKPDGLHASTGWIRHPLPQAPAARGPST